MDFKISREEINNALLRSGYLLESRLISTLVRNKYFVYPNDVYKDILTGKSREVDIYASSEIRARSIIFNKKPFPVIVRSHLVIECQNNPQPVVVFKRANPNQFTSYGKFINEFSNLRTINQNDPITDQIEFDIRTEFTSQFQLSNRFHYNTQFPSTQYCSFIKKGNNNSSEWMASHPDGLHETFSKLYSFINEKIGLRIQRREDLFCFEIFYPIIVFQGELMEVEGVGQGIVANDIDNALFEFNYFTDSSRSLLVDIVCERAFDSLLKKVVNERHILESMFVNILTEINVKYGLNI